VPSVCDATPLDEELAAEIAEEVAGDQEDNRQSATAVLRAKLNPAGCQPLEDWNRRAETVDVLEPFGAELLHAYGLTESAIDARRFMIFAYVCYSTFGTDISRFEYPALEAFLGDYPRLFSLQADPAEMTQLWTADLVGISGLIGATELDDPRLSFVLTAAEAFLYRWSAMPSGVVSGDAYRALEATVRSKMEELARQQLASAAAQTEQDLDARISAGLAGYSNQIAELGLADDFLDSVIILKGGGNRPWITLRSWIAALYATEAFDLIQGSQYRALRLTASSPKCQHNVRPCGCSTNKRASCSWPTRGKKTGTSASRETESQSTPLRCRKWFAEQAALAGLILPNHHKQSFDFGVPCRDCLLRCHAPLCNVQGTRNPVSVLALHARVCCSHDCLRHPRYCARHWER